MDKIQQEFEAWLKSNDQLTMKEDDGECSFQHTRFAFEAWKASRAALCVELPEIISCSDSSCLLGYSNAVDDFKQCLDLAGLSHK